MSGDGTAVCSCFELNHVVIRHQTRFIERDDPVIVGWGQGKPLQKGFDKACLRCVQETDLPVDFGKRRANRLTIERHRLTRVPWQDERLRWQREELVET